MDALQCLAAQSDPSNIALTVNLVRILADLAKVHDVHTQFERAAVPTMLVNLLREFPPAFQQSHGWWGTFITWLGYDTTSEKKDSAHRVDTVDTSLPRADTSHIVDYLADGLDLQAMLPSDLAAGVSYHAVRCVANLARNSAAHHDLLEAGLLPILLAFLRGARVDHVRQNVDEQVAEVVRCGILAVAALAKSASEEVVRNGGHRRLIYFTEQGEDGVAQMYAAGGLRNLARHSHGGGGWNMHRELVVGGVAEALAKGMSPEANAQTKVFCVLAFSDLMTTGHHKADIIRKRLKKAYEPFAGLVKEKNAAVAAAMHRSLMALYGEREVVGHIVAPEALGKLLGEESGQLVNGAVARGDVLALKAVRAMCRDGAVVQLMVDKGLLEVLVRGVNKGKGEYWEESVAALGELSNQRQLLPLIVSRGALRAVLKRPCLEHDGRWAAKFFANMARSEDHHVEIAHGALNILLRALVSKNGETRMEGARGLYNLSLGGVSRIMIGQAGALIPLVKAASLSGDTRRFAIGALAKISESYEHSTKLVEADLLGVLLSAVKEDVGLAKDVAHCIANLTQVVEVHGSLASSGAAAWLAEMTSRNGGRGGNAPDVLHYASLGICNLAYSPGITRQVLKESGVMPVLTALSSSGMSSPHVIYSARQALHNLRGEEKAGMLPVEASPKPSLPA